MRIRVRLLPAKAGATAAALLAAALFATAAAAAPAAELVGAGSTFAAPLYEKWINAFEKAHPDIALRYEAIGSGEGIARFEAGVVDFAGSDVVLPAAQAAKIPRGVIEVPSTAGMIVLAYNVPGFKGQLRLPQDVYTDIFLGKIRGWNDPRIAAANPGLAFPATDIAVVGRRDSSGTTYAFTNHLAAVSAQWGHGGPGVGKLVTWPRIAMLARGNEGVAARIKISEGSIGYVEYGFAQRLGLAIAALQNKDGQFVAPSPESGAAGLARSANVAIAALGDSTANPAGAAAYPIVTFSWLVFYGAYPAEKAQALQAFAEFALDKGQGYAAELGYVPLPRPVVDLGKSAISRLK